MNTLFIRYSSLTNLNYFWKPCPFFPVPIFWEALSNLFPVPACRRGGNPAWSALADFHHKVKQESGQLPFNQMMTYFTLISIYIVIYQGWSGKALLSRHLPSPHTNRFGSLKIPLLGHSSLTERIFFLSPGYWAVDVVAGEPFPAPAGEDQGLLLHLLQAITWAQELDLKVTHIGT